MLGSLIPLILLITVMLGSSAQPSTTGPLGDYGDAPDELSAGYTHASPQMTGSFPSILSAPQDPSYILHRFPQERVYLGQTVTVEDNALLVDRDLDDGWVPGSFLTCSRAQLSIHVTIPREATAGPIYLNVLFDWNHDGRWADFSACTATTQRDPHTADEWAIRNLALHQQPYSLAPGFSGMIDLPEIITGPLEGELWVRVTITTEPVDERIFVPVAFGGHGWNGQGDFLYGETEDYFSCLLVSSDKLLAGCPRPLSDQPPIDPPPSTSQNNAPIANDDTALLSEGASAVIEVLSNDSDPDNDSFSIVDVTQPAHGSVTINPNGTVTYIPEPGFSGTDSFSYTICDASGLCDSATVTITVTVTAINNPPVAEDDTVTTDEDAVVTVDVLANDTDVDSLLDPSTLSIISGPANGTTIVNPDGTATYTPNTDFNGTDTFIYQVCDNGNPVLCDTATVTVTINAVNDNPVASDDSAITNEDTIVNISVLANDTDIDGDTLIVTSFTQGTNGTISCNASQCTYTPNTNFSGADTFTYTISDGNGGTDTATVTITVNSVNDPPELAAISDQTVTEGQTLSVNVSCTDIDSSTLTLSAANLPPGAVFTDNGNGTGALSYTPDFDTVQHPAPQKTFSGVQISCSDSSLTDTKNFKITVNDVNRAPEAFPQSITTSEDTPIGITLAGSDPDGDPITFSLMSSPSHGTLSGFNPNTGAVTYTPNGNYNGPDSFTFRVNDGSLDSNIATVSITVTAVNDPPTLTPIPSQSVNEGQMLTLLVSCTDIDGPSLTLTTSNLPPGATFADNGDGTGTLTYTPAFDTVQHPNEQIVFSNISITCNDGSATDTDTFNLTVHDVNRVPDALNDSANTNEDTPVTVAVLANDSDPDGDTLTVISSSPAANGTVNCTTAGVCTYTPSANFSGTDAFSYTISDSRGGTDSATVTITINAVNDPPVAFSQSVSTPEDTPVAITLTCSDAEGDLITFSIVGSPGNGTLSGTPPNTTYTPNTDFNGNDSFTFKCNDGQLDSNTATVTITVNPINDAPELATISDQSVNEGQTLTVNATCADIDSLSLTLTASNLPTGATFTDHGNGTGTFTYSPDFDVVQHPNTSTLFQNVQVTCSDGNGSFDTETFNITVNDVNRNPIANDDTVTTDEDTPVVIDVRANDTDPDGDALTVTSFTQGTNGTVSCTATQCTYTPNANFHGTDTFTYTISDGHGGTDTATVTITVNDLTRTTTWDKSSLTFISSGKSCEGKTVFATVKNVGSPMQGPTTWELYYSASGNPQKNGVLIASGTIPALASDQEFTILMSVTQKGNYKFRAIQRPGHPGKGDLWSDTIDFDCN